MKRTKRITIQLTPDEYSRIAAAADLDARSVADFMRIAARERVTEVARATGLDDVVGRIER